MKEVTVLTIKAYAWVAAMWLWPSALTTVGFLTWLQYRVDRALDELAEVLSGR